MIASDEIRLVSYHIAQEALGDQVEAGEPVAEIIDSPMDCRSRLTAPQDGIIKTAPHVRGIEVFRVA